MPASALTPSVAQHAAGDTATQLLLRRAELAAIMERLTGQVDGTHPTAIPDLQLLRVSTAQELTSGLSRPALCVPAQGRKRVLLAGEATVYDPDDYLVVTHDLPTRGQVFDATPETPYLCVRLDLQAAELATMISEMGDALAPARACTRALYTGRTQLPLMDALLRLVRLADTPRDIATLAPLIKREILYRLLSAEEGWRLAQLCLPHGQGQRIAAAIAQVRARFREPLAIEELAHAVHMSASSLHRHFKAATAMSPLQYQKQLRLQEARRLLLSREADATSAAYQVGYESASQFSREYARLFGAPPARDLRRMRQDSQRS